MDDFHVRVLPVLFAAADRNFNRDDPRWTDTLTAGWFGYDQAGERAKDLAADQFAWYALKRAYSGRDLPGVDASRKHDAMDANCWVTPGMGEVVDKRARRPEVILEAREQLERVQREANTLQAELVQLVIDEMLRTDELAQRLNRTAGRVSQLRRELAKILKDG